MYEACPSHFPICYKIATNSSTVTVGHILNGRFNWQFKILKDLYLKYVFLLKYLLIMVLYYIVLNSLCKL